MMGCSRIVCFVERKIQEKGWMANIYPTLSNKMLWEC